jgi:hypothetical protein
MTEAIDTPASDDPPADLPIEVRVQMTIDGREAWLLLSPIAGGDSLEIPLTRADAVQLIAGLAEFAYPGCRLRSASPAGQA